MLPEALSEKRPLVLVVDDNRPVRQAIQWALEEEGFGVLTAGDGEEAVRHVVEHQPAVVILDINLPLLDGYEVSRALRERYAQDVPILAVTADGQAHSKAVRVGAYDYLRKPFDLPDLLAAVRRGLQQRGG